MKNQAIRAKGHRQLWIFAPNRGAIRAAKSLAIATALLGVPFSTPAFAAVWCESKVARVFTDKSGSVFMLPYFRNDWVQVCNLEVTWKDVPTTTCSSWVQTLTSGVLTGKLFTFHYSDPITVCSAIPSYGSAPSPSYVMIAEI